MSEMLKYGLKMVEENEATDELIPLYETVKRDFQMPHVPNMIKAIAISPASLQLYINMLKSFYAEITLPSALTTMILFTIAKKSKCTYCTAVHEVTCRTLGVDEDTLDALAENLSEVNPERIRAIIEFSLKAAKHPQDLIPEDYDGLREMGISNDEIVQIVFVASIAVFVDIIADALKVEVDQKLINALENR